MKPWVRTLVDSSLDASCVVDEELRVLHYNANYVRLSGLRHRDLRNPTMQGLCHTHFALESCDEGGCVAKRAYESGRPCRVDEVRSNRFNLCLIVVAIPLLDESGQVQAVMEQYRDVTAESRMQANYKQLLDYQRRQNEILQAEVDRQTRELEDANRELQDALQAVEQLARTDALTQLANRRHFDELFGRELELAVRQGRELALIVLDLDHFKRINDEHGHLAGDAVLRRFAEVLRDCAGPNYVLARIGGEEFTVLLPDAPAERARQYYKRLQKRLLEAGFPTTLSAGIATFPRDAATGVQLFACADRALYAAKTGGRNRVVTSADLPIFGS